jgi:beta-N-acetylhexosaminidase
VSLTHRLIVGIRGKQRGDETLERDLDACAEAGVAGVIYFSKDLLVDGLRNIQSPSQLADLSAYIRERLSDRTIISVDQEGGRVARLTPDLGFAPLPSARELATMSDTERRDLLDASCREMASCGITLNFAPCVDVPVDAGGPVIAALGRTFGDDAATVSRVAADVVGAHRRHDLTPCLKHFPGHGSASADSHKALPDVTNSWRREAELQPFIDLLANDIWVMTAHLFHRHLDADAPASLSRRVTTGLLRNELGFDGKIVTDSLDMAGARADGSLADTLRRAADAGADYLLHGCNSPLGEYASDVIAAAQKADDL